MRLENKIALVTGGSQGIGKAIAQEFLKEGAKVAIFDRKRPDYSGIDYYSVDIRNEQQILEAVASIPKLDILVNNAGVYLQATIEDTTEEQLDLIVDTNFKGTYLVSKHMLPLIRKSKGSIIHISSGLGIVPEPDSPAYCATKAALIMLTRTMAQRYGKEGIRTNCICPGPIDTPLLRAAFPTQEAIQDYAKLNPSGRVGQPIDVAKMAVFLSSTDALFVNGGVFAVDGGESAAGPYQPTLPAAAPLTLSLHPPAHNPS